MNKNHQVIWSSIRGCFVVTSEKTKSNGKPSSTKKTIAIAVASMFFTPGIASAIVCSGTNPVSTSLTTTQCYGDSDITVNTGAGVAVVDGYAVIAGAPDYTSIFINNGSLSGLLTSADIQTSIGTVNSYITAVDHSAILFSGNFTGSFTNGVAGAIASQIDISTSATSSDATYAYAYAYTGQGSKSYDSGIAISGDVGASGLISNIGDISAAAISNAQAQANVIKTIDNSNDYAYAYAYSGRTITKGVSVNGNLDGGIVNQANGLISASTDTTTTASSALDNDVYTGGNGYLFSKAHSYSVAYGIHINGSLGANSSINNFGSIVTNSTSLTTSSATASSGYLQAYAYSNAQSYSVAYGIEISGQVGLGALINNDGTISILSQSTASSNADGTASLMKDRSISNAYASAYGVRIRAGVNGGSLINQNSINASVSGTSDSNATGTDLVIANSNGGGRASGLAIGSFYDGTHNISLNGILTNSGDLTISSTQSSHTLATSTATYDNAYAHSVGRANGNISSYGMYLNNYFATNASLVNNGNINTNSTSISNISGISSASVTGDNAYAHAYGYAYGYARSLGIGVSSGLLADASITNNNSIVSNSSISASSNATADATSSLSHSYANTKTRTYANAYGIYIGYGGLRSGSSVNNNGTITVTANAGATATASSTGPNATSDAYAYSYAFATGVETRGRLDSSAAFNNIGTISAIATSNAQATAGNNTITNTYARAYGLNFRNQLLTGSVINNSGTITATANGIDAQAYGIKINSSLDGSLINSGRVYGTTNSDPLLGYSVYVNSGAGAIDNQLGGLLQGNLYVGGAVEVNNAGTIYLPEGADAQIAGNYTQTTTGIFKIDVAGMNTTEYGKLLVGGNASIAGKADVNVKSVNSLAIGQTILGVISAGTLSGNFTNVMDNSVLFNFNSLVNGNNIDLEVIKGLTVTQAVIATGNTSGTGAAGVLDNIIAGNTPATPGMDVVITALGKLDTEEKVSDAVSQTLPILTGALPQVIGNTLHVTSRIIQSRQDGQQGRSSGDEFFGDKNAWFKPFGSWENQNDRKGVSGFDANTYGMLFGVDSEISDLNRVGIAFAYAHSNVDGNSDVAKQRANIDSYQITAYGSHSIDDNTDLNFEADIGRHNNEGTRYISFANSVAKSDFSSWSGHVGLGLARTYGLTEKTSLTPSIRADYTLIRDESYKESGAGALNLNVNSNITHELLFGIDGKLTHELSDTAKFTANLGLGYDAINDRASISSAFAGSPSATFVTKGIDPSPWLVRGGLGIVSNATETIEISARYDIEARKDFDNQTASVKVRWSF